MKNTLVIETDNEAQIASLLLFLKEVGIKASLIKKDTDNLSISMVSEPSLAEAWSSKEDQRWDEIYSTKK